MAHYDFLTIWRTLAPLEAVWDAIHATQQWPEWWVGVESAQPLKPPGQDELGGIIHYRWKGQLPYTIEFDAETTRMELLHVIEARVDGDVRGMGIWEFLRDGNITEARYAWQVDTTKPWMNLISPVASPLIRWNHDVIMRWGAEGLSERLGAEVRRRPASLRGRRRKPARKRVS